MDDGDCVKVVGALVGVCDGPWMRLSEGLLLGTSEGDGDRFKEGAAIGANDGVELGVFVRPKTSPSCAWTCRTRLAAILPPVLPSARHGKFGSMS